MRAAREIIALQCSSGSAPECGILPADMAKKKDPRAERKRRALQAFMDRHGLTVTGWARKADISEGTLRNFLKGTSSSLNQSTVDKLAEAIGVSSQDMFAPPESGVPMSNPDNEKTALDPDAAALAVLFAVLVRSLVSHEVIRLQTVLEEADRLYNEYAARPHIPQRAQKALIYLGNVLREAP